jgi:MFS transporter, UMF1 family
MTDRVPSPGVVSGGDAITTTTTTTTTSSNPPLPCWFPHICGRPVYHGNEEALAWCLDGIGRAIQFVGAGAFVGTALIAIASKNAGCETEPPEGETVVPPCHNRIYGIKPSSLLSTYTMVIGVSSTVLLPLLGAVIDHTPHRRLLGRIVSFLFVTLMIPQLWISYDSFVMTALFQVATSITGWAQTTITYAYLPELTDDEYKLNDYTKSYTMFFFSCMVLYLAVVIGAVGVLGKADDDIATARLGISVALAVNLCFLPIAWGRLFKNRPAMHQLQEGQSLWTAGFIQLHKTSKNIAKNYCALKWFYISIAFSDAGMQSIGAIALSFWSNVLQFSAQESGIGVLVILISSVPGAFVANRCTRRWDPVKSSMAALVLLTATCILYSALVYEPGQKALSYFLSFGFGFGIGWKWTNDRMLTSVIIPKGQDAELMGVFLFAGQVLNWMPALVYFLINESDISPRLGIASLCFWFGASFICYIMMGSYENARNEANRGGGGVDGEHDKEIDSDAPLTVDTSPKELELSEGIARQCNP